MEGFMNKKIVFIILLGVIFASIVTVSASFIMQAKQLNYSGVMPNTNDIGTALNNLYDSAYGCSYAVGKQFNYDYSGYTLSFHVPCNGIYKLETWGAQGGSTNTTYIGGYGSYSMGLTKLAVGATLYVTVGGSTTSTTGGFNGGGSGATNGTYSGYGGGGATHIAYDSGYLYSLSLAKVIIASGGGGVSVIGDNNSSRGGDAGGYLGNSATSLETYYINPTGGSQSAGGSPSDGGTAGSFGKGGNGLSWSGGGGGLYGGGGGCGAAGGGGSGYISYSSLFSSSNIEKHMTCYNCQTSTDASTMTNTTTNVSSTATADYAKAGNGHARITYLGMALN